MLLPVLAAGEKKSSSSCLLVSLFGLVVFKLGGESRVNILKLIHELCLLELDVDLITDLIDLLLGLMLTLVFLLLSFVDVVIGLLAGIFGRASERVVKRKEA